MKGVCLCMIVECRCRCVCVWVLCFKNSGQTHVQEQKHDPHERRSQPRDTFSRECTLPQHVAHKYRTRQQTTEFCSMSVSRHVKRRATCTDHDKVGCVARERQKPVSRSAATRRRVSQPLAERREHWISLYPH